MTAPSDRTQLAGLVAGVLWFLIGYILKGGGPLHTIGPLTFFAALCAAAPATTIYALMCWRDDASSS